MKRRTVRLLWAAAILLLLAELIVVNRPERSPAPVGAAPGERMADFSVSCMDGSEFTLSAHRGKVVVVNLWATWCTPCVKELPNFDRLQSEHPADAVVLALHSPPVTTDVAEYLSAFSYGIAFAVDADGSLSGMLNASTVLPQTVIIGPDGIVTYNQSGTLSYEKLLALVTEAKGQK